MRLPWWRTPLPRFGCSDHGFASGRRTHRDDHRGDDCDSHEHNCHHPPVRGELRGWTGRRHLFARVISGAAARPLS